VAAIRPDDVVVGGTPGNSNVFRGNVEIVEYLGRENEIILTLEAGPRLWVRTPAPIPPGGTVTVTLPPDKVTFLPPGGTEATA
jgi:hypothetical protein